MQDLQMLQEAARRRDDRARLVPSNGECFAHCKHISYYFNKYSLSPNRGLLGCLLGYWPLGQNPFRGNYQNTRNDYLISKNTFGCNANMERNERLLTTSVKIREIISIQKNVIAPIQVLCRTQIKLTHSPLLDAG